MTPWILGLVCGTGGCLAGVTVLLVYFKRRPSTIESSKTGREGPAQAKQKTLRSAPQSPLARIKFKDAIDRDELAPEIQRHAQDMLNFGLAAQGANFLIQAIELGERTHTLNITYRFSEMGYHLLREKTVAIATHTNSGQWLPELRDRGGHFTELAKGHKNVLGELANVSSLLISAAHIVVSIDNLHRLKRIESKLDELLASRRNDQLAKLERLYVRGGEITLRHPYGTQSFELTRYRDELYDLRAAWRMEIEGILQSAKDPTARAWWNQPLFGAGLTILHPLGWVINWGIRNSITAREKELFEHLSPIIEIVRCIRLAFLIDVCIAQWDGTSDILFAHTLRAEANLWAGIVEKINVHKSKFQNHQDAPFYIETATQVGNAVRVYIEAITGEKPSEESIDER